MRATPVYSHPMPGGRRSPRDRALRARILRRNETTRPELRIGSPIAGTGGIDRREFLRLGGLVGLGLLTGCVENGTTGSASRERVDGLEVGIVGAGLAGLTAAYWLDRAGVDCVVFEASERVGGRCWSARGYEGAQVGEHGGEFIDTRHIHIRTLVSELGLDLDDTWESWAPASTSLQFVDGEAENLDDEHDWIGPAIERLFELAALGPLGNGSGPPELLALDEMTAEDWYRTEVGRTDDANFRRWSRDLSAWFGLDPDRLGAGNLIEYYTFDYEGADERYTVRGGNDRVPELIVEGLPENTVVYQAPVEAVSTGPNGVEVVFGGNVGARVFDHVILAIPFTMLREVDTTGAGLPAPLLGAIDQLEMGTNSKLIMQFDKPFFTSFGGWSGLLEYADDPQFGSWESGSTDGSSDFGLLTVYTGGQAGASYDPPVAHAPAAESVVTTALDALDEAVPGVADSYLGGAWLDSWVDSRWAGGSYAAFGPGQVGRFWGALSAPQGRIHVAGEQTSTFSQGFLNGAVESGYRVATEVLEATGLAVPETLRRTTERAKQYLPGLPYLTE